MKTIFKMFDLREWYVPKKYFYIFSSVFNKYLIYLQGRTGQNFTNLEIVEICQTGEGEIKFIDYQTMNFRGPII